MSLVVPSVLWLCRTMLPPGKSALTVLVKSSPPSVRQTSLILWHFVAQLVTGVSRWKMVGLLPSPAHLEVPLPLHSHTS